MPWHHTGRGRRVGLLITMILLFLRRSSLNGDSWSIAMSAVLRREEEEGGLLLLLLGASGESKSGAEQAVGVRGSGAAEQAIYGSGRRALERDEWEWEWEWEGSLSVCP